LSIAGSVEQHHDGILAEQVRVPLRELCLQEERFGGQLRCFGASRFELYEAARHGRARAISPRRSCRRSSAVSPL
jgi:hypothetical protein